MVRDLGYVAHGVGGVGAAVGDIGHILRDIALGRMLLFDGGGDGGAGRVGNLHGRGGDVGDFAGIGRNFAHRGRGLTDGRGDIGDVLVDLLAIGRDAVDLLGCLLGLVGHE